MKKPRTQKRYVYNPSTCNYDIATQTTCPACRGCGINDDGDTCQYCNGRGRAWYNEYTGVVLALWGRHPKFW